MNVLTYLIPISLILGGLGLAAFIYSVRTKQYDDPDGNAARILSDEWDDKPKQ
ncbi:MAG: cbb3-type cytochrome oxidase assembly protein CcoS [Planktotalea sp.]|uniref:cbb3-type cytochrome oxidase assembly protein CcoS n=1 Tax=Planktotalea sp. TaxID=2029877 RepID=UPI003C74A5C2